MKIGIFGCTADPFTCAHYEIVRKVLVDKIVDKVIVIPTIVDYYRKDKTELFDLSQRRQIIEKWFDSVDNVILDFHEYEIAVNTKLYYDDQNEICNRRYIHMLSDLIRRIDPRHDNEWFTIIGNDSFQNFKTWYDWKSILEKSKLIVVNRYQKEESGGPLDIHEIPIHIDKKFWNISATNIRKHLIDTISGMSLGSNTTCLDLYLEEVDDYLKTGKTYEDRANDYRDTKKKLLNAIKNKKSDDILLGDDKSEPDTGIVYTNLFKTNDVNEIKNRANVTFTDSDGNELIANTPIFDLVKAPEVEAGFRPIKIKSNDWVTIVVEKDGKFLVEKQFRHGLGKEFEEFPCGIVEKNELPIVAAFRELREETGIEVKRYALRYLGKYAANPAFMTNYMHYFYIELKDYDQYDQQLDEHEHIDWYWKDKNKAFESFLNSNGSALGGSCWMLLIREGIITEWND